MDDRKVALFASAQAVAEVGRCRLWLVFGMKRTKLPAAEKATPAEVKASQRGRVSRRDTRIPPMLPGTPPGTAGQ